MITSTIKGNKVSHLHGLSYPEIYICYDKKNNYITSKNNRISFLFYFEIIKFFGIRTLLFLVFLDIYNTKLERHQLEKTLIKYYHKELGFYLTKDQIKKFKNRII